MKDSISKQFIQDNSYPLQPRPGRPRPVCPRLYRRSPWRRRFLFLFHSGAVDTAVVAIVVQAASGEGGTAAAAASASAHAGSLKDILQWFKEVSIH